MGQELRELLAGHFWLNFFYQWQSDSRWSQKSRGLEQPEASLAFLSLQVVIRLLHMVSTYGLLRAPSQHGEVRAGQVRAPVQGRYYVTFSDQASDLSHVISILLHYWLQRS